MRPTTVIKALLTLVCLLVITNLFATYKAFNYRDKYRSNPLVKVEQRSSVIYGKFDPDRSQAYTCILQKTIVDHVGMICSSPDQDVVINCTVGTGSEDNPDRYYFC